MQNEPLVRERLSEPPCRLQPVGINKVITVNECDKLSTRFGNAGIARQTWITQVCLDCMSIGWNVLIEALTSCFVSSIENEHPFDC